jgi:hypothetical protein
VFDQAAFSSGAAIVAIRAGARQSFAFRREMQGRGK